MAFDESPGAVLRSRAAPSLTLEDGEAVRDCTAGPRGVVASTSLGRLLHGGRAVDVASAVADYIAAAELEDPSDASDGKATKGEDLAGSSSPGDRDSSSAEDGEGSPSRSARQPAPATSPAGGAQDRARVLAVATARVATLGADSLPEQRSFAVCLVADRGVCLFRLPELALVDSIALLERTKYAKYMAIDQLNQTNPFESFRLVVAFDSKNYDEQLQYQGSDDEDDDSATDDNEHAPPSDEKQSQKPGRDGTDKRPADEPTGTVVVLFEVSPGGQKPLKQLGRVSVADSVVSIAFGGMTVVATSADAHYMLRIARDGSLAEATTVPLYEFVGPRRPRKRQEAPPPSVFSIFSSFFGRRPQQAEVVVPVYAIPMPEERWLLVVDHELIAYSSFGQRVAEMEHVFKSKLGVALDDERMEAALAPTEQTPQSPKPSQGVWGGISQSQRGGALVRSESVQSFTSTGTSMSIRTAMEEPGARRAEKQPLDSVFVSPFVLSMTTPSEILVFASNGSISGALEAVQVHMSDDIVPLPPLELEPPALGRRDATRMPTGPTSRSSLELSSTGGTPMRSPLSTPQRSVAAQPQDPDSEPPSAEPLTVKKGEEKWVRLVPTLGEYTRVAFVVWPDGHVADIEVTKPIYQLREDYENEGMYQRALALVSSDDTERAMGLRRKLAREAREKDWHDLAVQHMEVVVSLGMKGSMLGSSQHDLLVEAAELRGPSDSSWKDDPGAARLWANFLYRLRRQIMRPGPADPAVLESLCAVDVEASRIISILSVQHAISLGEGEHFIVSNDCCLTEKERVLALVALYKSLKEHNKALSLLEDSGGSIDDVCEYLVHNVQQEADKDVYFRHLSWLAAEPDRHDKLLEVLVSGLPVAAHSRPILTESLNTLVRGAAHLIPSYIESVLDVTGDSEQSSEGIPASETTAEESSTEESSEDKSGTAVLARALLGAMTTAQMMEKPDVVDKLRPIFRSQVLHRPKADYDTDAMLAALRNCPGLELHEEVAYLLGRQGQHKLAAVELAAESSISASEAIKRLRNDVPPAMHSDALASLATAYLKPSDTTGRSSRPAAAAEIAASEHGYLDAARVLQDASGPGNKLRLEDARDFAVAALGAATERIRLAQMTSAVRKSEARRLKEELLVRRRQHVVIGRDRVCSKCGRPIGDSVFAAYPDGSVMHLVCHLSMTRAEEANDASFQGAQPLKEAYEL